MTPAKGYAKMKDSGIEWVGMIPATWDVFPAGGVFDEVKEKNVNNQYSNPFSFRYGEIVDKKIVGEIDESVEETLSAYRVVSPNTIMINGLNLNYDFISQRVAIVREKGIITSAYLAVQPDEGRIVPRFVLYLLKAYDYRQVFHGVGSGIRKTLKFQDFKSIKIVAPSLTEQTAIAAYLDTQCAKIDEIIAQAKASIEDYKQWKVSIIHKVVTKGMGNNRPMKDSGILWIKKIPESWSVRKVKFAIFPLERPVLNTDEVITCFRDGEVTLRKNRRTDGFTVSFTEHGYQGVEKGDLVIHGMDAFAGAIGCSDCRGKTTPVVHVCKTIGNNRYFMYALRNMALSNVFTDFSNGVRIRSSDFRNFSKLGDFLIAIPPITEQGEIVDYLDSMTSKIDMLVTEKQRLLDDLESYKKSLIYEVVTGKRRVISNG